MQSAQKLQEGLITYHRTDSTNLATEAVTTAREFIGKIIPQYVPDQHGFSKLNQSGTGSP